MNLVVLTTSPKMVMHARETLLLALTAVNVAFCLLHRTQLASPLRHQRQVLQLPHRQRRLLLVLCLLQPLHRPQPQPLCQLQSLHQLQHLVHTLRVIVLRLTRTWEPARELPTKTLENSASGAGCLQSRLEFVSPKSLVAMELLCSLSNITIAAMAVLSLLFGFSFATFSASTDLRGRSEDMNYHTK